MDHIVARTCRLADALVRISARQMKQRWNIRNTDLRLLNVLDDVERLSVNEISRRALLDQAWVSRSLRALEARGLVHRCADASDSRLTLVSLTQSGREILDESRPYAAWSERVLLRGVDEVALKALLDQVEANTQGLIDTFENLDPGPKRCGAKKK
ncbi:MAG TPA: MarR family winged helix-turn-helix transcriptional regulator [Steroidobacteraceae bacterium]|nr:MarR family winged helix-turn-helix transcriptional regulator [Steroidobacteraceae bacterium]